MPKQLIGSIGGTYLKNSKSVLFHPQPCDALEALTRVMSSGFVSLFTTIFVVFCIMRANFYDESERIVEVELEVLF
jgi:Mediator complex subunit 25 PTOV activation and synapsin 2